MNTSNRAHPLPGMKPLTEYALTQLRYRKLLKLHYSQAILVSPASKVYYYQDMHQYASQRRYEWFSTPQAVLSSPFSTKAMKNKALMIRNSRNGFTRPPKKRVPRETPVQINIEPLPPAPKAKKPKRKYRKIIPGIVPPHPFYTAKKKPAPLDEDWI